MIWQSYQNDLGVRFSIQQMAKFTTTLFLFKQMVKVLLLFYFLCYICSFVCSFVCISNNIKYFGLLPFAKHCISSAKWTRQLFVIYFLRVMFVFFCFFDIFALFDVNVPCEDVILCFSISVKINGSYFHHQPVLGGPTTTTKHHQSPFVESPFGESIDQINKVEGSNTENLENPENLEYIHHNLQNIPLDSVPGIL